MRYIVLDPSGNFDEGKGHTGMAVLDGDSWESLASCTKYANRFATRHDYWTDVTDAVLAEATVPNSVVIIESFVVRSNGFMLGKMPETIRFIGHLEYELEKHGVPYTFQTPSQAKSRFKDADLVRIIPNLELRKATNRYYLNGKVCSDHARDALKHLLYFKRYKEATWTPTKTKSF